ncbi:MAG TPA: TerB N-terminal domain-containing protein [Thermoanaerobaculia bacterium]|nr:TerB N-terminal domain-containing protein [Thermoanaerobaculia bacterium]
MRARKHEKAGCPGDRFWVPAGTVVDVAGHRIDGMVYVGSGLGPVSWGRQPVEPALLDPFLPVARRKSPAARPLEPRPVYFRMLPSHRAAYLRWLEGGRKDPAADIGFVFLFFSGIERRVLVDAKVSDRARRDVAGLAAETERLLDLYGGNAFFGSYAETFLLLARLLSRSVDVTKLVPPPRSGYRGYSLPLALKAALGAFAARGERIPPEWAYAWAVNALDVRLGLPADRTPDEFEALFKLRYAESLPGGGLRIWPNRKPSSVLYYPASPSFFGPASVLVKNLARESELVFCRHQLQEAVNQAARELHAYSRRMTDARWRRSPATVTLLPPELARQWHSQEIQEFLAWTEGELAAGEPAPVPAGDLIRRWTGGAVTRLTRGDAEKLASFLGRRGYGMEPDIRLGGALPDGDGKAPVVLFRQAAEEEVGPVESSPAWRAAAVLLQLAVALAVADGPVNDLEERYLLAYFDTTSHFPLDERKRLAAHLIRIMTAPPGLSGLKQGIARLTQEQRRMILRFLIVLAEADGSVQTAELKLLRRIYALLGQDHQSLYSDVHAVASAMEPVTVRPAGAGAAGFAIPPASPGAGIALDEARIRTRLAETAEIAGILDAIFREEEPPGPPTVAGLDGAHSAFLRRLAEKTVWERSEVERLAAGLSLLPDGALETLNETAFESYGTPLLEGDETLVIDNQVLQEMLA